MDRQVQQLKRTGKIEQTAAALDCRPLDVYYQENSSCQQHYSLLECVCCVHKELCVDSHNEGKGYADIEYKLWAHRETSSDRSKWHSKVGSASIASVFKVRDCNWRSCW